MKKNTIIKWTIIVVVSLAVLAGIGFGGYKSYRGWKAQRLLTQAKAHLAQDDARSATLALRQLLTSSPDHREATRMMAELTDKMGTPNAISWWRKLSELEPNDFQNNLSWARSAMREKQYAVAEEAIKAVPTTKRTNAVFYHVAAGIALGLGKFSEAESNGVQAVKLAPSNEVYLLDLAAMRLRSTNAAVATEARAQVERLIKSDLLGCYALQTLVTDAMRETNVARGLAYSTELQAKPCVTFADKLTHLSLLDQSARTADVDVLLEKLIPQAEKQAGQTFELATWMASHKRQDRARKWLEGLPPDLKAQQPVRAALADAYAFANDWPAVENTLTGHNWGDLDFVRMALLARAFKGQGDNRRALAMWSQAVNKAGNAPERLLLLYRSSSGWGWVEETDSLLWALSERPNYFDTTMRTLYRRCEERKDTRQLQRIAARVLEVYPNDEIMKNNFAVFSLLLDLHVDRAFAYAEELHKKYPESGIIGSTYALALFRRGEHTNALNTMRSIPAEFLKDPSVSAYYGIILAVSGSPNEAIPYLKAAEKADLLPEEKALIAKITERHIKN
jgi:tetratricopeptide (TPR) repeat protein